MFFVDFLFNFSAANELIITLFCYLSFCFLSPKKSLCMEKHVHFSEQDSFEAKDWRPWVILGLLALVITFALFSY